MSTSVPTNGRATMAALRASRKGTNRKRRPRSPEISVCPKRWVWLVWMSNGVRIQTLAALDSSPRSISRSALASPWRMPAIGRSGARLAWTAEAEIPTEVAACANAASDPHPIPMRNSEQKTLALTGKRERCIPFMGASIVDDQLGRHDVGGLRRLGDGDPGCNVREDRLIGSPQPVLEPQLDPIDRMARARVGDAERAQLRDEPREVHDRHDGERLQHLRDAGPRAVEIVEQGVSEREAQPAHQIVVEQAVEAEPVHIRDVDEIGGEGNPAPAEGDVRLAAVGEFTGEQQLRGRRPGHVAIDDPARVRIVVVLLGSPEATDPEVQQPAAVDGRHAHPATDALRAVVVLDRVLGGLVLPAVHHPSGNVEPGRELVRRLQPGHALRPAEPLQLGGRGGQVECGVVALVPERRVEAAEREREAVPDRRDSGDVEAVQADLGLDRLAAELLGAGARRTDGRARTTEGGIEAVAVSVPMALHFDARTGREPRRKRLEGADAELVEAEIDSRRLGRHWRAAGEFGDHLDARVVVGRADEEAGQPDTRRLEGPAQGARVLQANLALLT